MCTKMDQEFEEAPEQKLHNEDEQGGLGLGLNQDQSEDEFPELQSQGGHEQGLDQGLEIQGRDLGQELEIQGQEQGQHKIQGQEQGQHKIKGKGRLFGREKPVHSALGGGASADLILWRNKQVSAALLAGSTVIWLLFEWIGYHLIPFICHFLILALATLFLWSNLSFYVHKSPLNLPVIELPQDLCTAVALLLCDRCNQAITMLWEVTSGKDLKKFLTAIFALWIVSIVGSWFDLLTIIYIINVLILTMPSLYEKNEDRVDSYALKAKARLKRQYSKLDEKVLQKLPKVPFISDNKQQ
ncbi:reticulon-like protein B4 isoform X2 [Salvia hispanica]|uniref:reticulon-like protein B4 isoform X2 n=1 Tax=Salvia hispanica TaxID=49212 RepID=UPI0020098781|nr:reticulon-like protein B4 isoform X2 [Salvia hispanica]